MIVSDSKYTPSRILLYQSCSSESTHRRLKFHTLITKMDLCNGYHTIYVNIYYLVGRWAYIICTELVGEVALQIHSIEITGWLWRQNTSNMFPDWFHSNSDDSCRFVWFVVCPGSGCRYPSMHPHWGRVVWIIQYSSSNVGHRHSLWVGCECGMMMIGIPTPYIVQHHHDVVGRDQIIATVKHSYQSNTHDGCTNKTEAFFCDPL